MKSSEELLAEFIAFEQSAPINVEQEAWYELNRRFPAGRGRSKMRGELYKTIYKEMWATEQKRRGNSNVIIGPWKREE